jgi:hypothetical protein
MAVSDACDNFLVVVGGHSSHLVVLPIIMDSCEWTSYPVM